MVDAPQIKVAILCDKTRLYDNLDTAIAYLQEVKNKHPDARLGEDWYDGYSFQGLEVLYYRDETEDEKLTREKVENEKAQLELNEYNRELQALKEKYGK